MGKNAETVAREVLAVQRTHYEGQPERLIEVLAQGYVDMQQRCQDLEMMLRATIPSSSITRTDDGKWLFWKLPADLDLMEDDGTGLPLLTEAAREELRRGLPR